MPDQPTETRTTDVVTAPRPRGRPRIPRGDAAGVEPGSTPGSPGERHGAPDYNIAVLDRALDVLEAIAAEPAPIGVTDVARRVGTTKSAAFRILTNLERRGYVTKNASTAKYALGTRLAFLGERSLETIDLRQLARPTLESLHRRFQETVNLGVLEGGEVVYIDMIESQHGLRMAARVGARDSVHSTALGKAILAAASDSRRERVLRGRLAKWTERTMTDPVALRAELEKVRVAGVAEDHGENETGARCLGAPIFNHAGEVMAAISVSAPASRLDDTRAAEVAGALREAAAEITYRVTGQRPEVSRSVVGDG